MANSVLSVKCTKRIHGRCAKVMRVTPRVEDSDRKSKNWVGEV